MSSQGANLEAIARAIDQHNANCEYPAIEVRMCPFEVERLDWDTIRGLPVVADPELGTGRFRIVCAGQSPSDGSEITEAVSERELVSV